METGRAHPSTQARQRVGARARRLWISGRLCGPAHLSTGATTTVVAPVGNTLYEATTRLSVTLPIDATRTQKPLTHTQCLAG